jgi:tetratricopeptide (TPR) repeat protein
MQWLLNISEVYYQMGNYDKALEVIDTPPSKISNASADARVQNQQAKIYARKNELDKTKDIYSNSLNKLRSSKIVDEEEEKSLQTAKEEIANVLHDQRKYDEEIDLRKQSIEYNLESNNLSEVAKDKVAISNTLAAKGETSAAILEMEEAAALADTLNDPKEQAQAFLALAELYEKNGSRDKALSIYKRYSVAVQHSEKVNNERLEERSNLLKQQKDIEALTKDISIDQYKESSTVFRQRVIIYGLIFAVLVSIVISYLIYKNAQAGKAANELLALKSLRSQMNPHFIFNALNSVNHFIAQQNERTANKFLSEFSQLMRLVLEYSQEDFISLQKEYEILSLYVKLEHYRFRDKFDYELVMDESINAEAIEVPPMLIQPYIENAVWHGLRYKETKGKLLLEFRRDKDDLIVKISDDGIGRKKSGELKTVNQKKHNSTGLKNIQERLSIMNKVYKARYKVSIKDLDHDRGTEVQIVFPINGRKQMT